MTKAAIIVDIHRPYQPRTFILVWSTTIIAKELRGGRRDFQFRPGLQLPLQSASSVVTTFSARLLASARRAKSGASCGNLPRKGPDGLFDSFSYRLRRQHAP